MISGPLILKHKNGKNCKKEDTGPKIEKGKLWSATQNRDQFSCLVELNK